MVSGKDFMNVADAAALLGVHIQTLRRLARQKQIPAFKLGRDWRFRKEALIRWADDQHVEGHEAHTISVLVIDDEERMCSILTKILQRFGCRARHALDGITGLDLVAQETPDIILLDLVMPTMNGPQFLAKLRTTHPKLPVIIVTGFPDSTLMQQAMQHAPIMLIPKPVDIAALQRTIESIVGELPRAAGAGGDL